MEYKEIKAIHKKIQAQCSSQMSEADRIFVRHWNVFYNGYRGRDLMVIEKFSRTPLILALVEHISKICSVENPSLTKTEYQVEVGFGMHLAQKYSNLYKLMEKEVGGE